MIVTGREEMTSQPTPQALEQLGLRYRLAAQAARGYWEAGFSVVLQDNYYGPDLAGMVDLLRGIPVRVVVLCPDVETVKAREAARGKTGYVGCPDVETVKAREAARGKTGYVGFAPAPLLEAFRRETPRLGFWLDNSRLTVEGSVEKILEHFSA